MICQLFMTVPIGWDFSHPASCFRPVLYSIRPIDAVLLGGSGGLRGKYNTTHTKQNAAIPRSETNFNKLKPHA